MEPRSLVSFQLMQGNASERTIGYLVREGDRSFAEPIPSIPGMPPALPQRVELRTDGLVLVDSGGHGGPRHYDYLDIVFVSEQ